MLSKTITQAPLRWAALNGARSAESVERLSSGLRVNRASDDAAGLMISERMRSQVIGAARAGRNVQDAISFISIAEDGVQNLLAPLQRIRELVIRAGNSTHGASERQAMQAEIDSLKQLAVTAYQLAQQSNMNFALPPGSRFVQFQVGANQGDTLTYDYHGLRDSMAKFLMDAFGYQEMYNSPLQSTLAAQLGGVAPPPSPALQALVPKRLDITVPGGVSASLQVIEEAFNGGPSRPLLGFPATRGLLGELAGLGAVHNRLQHAYSAVMAARENQAAAESRIRDVDVAGEMASVTRSQVLQRASIAMVAQANTHLALVKQLVAG